MFLLILSYFNANDLINLCYVSKYCRKCVLTKFDTYYNISTGFCSIGLWTNKIQGNLWGLIDNIFNDLTADFDPEGYYQLLFKEFHHLSLFSVCLHFLRCQRSCEKNYAAYCRLCSRVKDNNFFEYNAFQCIKVSDIDGYLGLSSHGKVDFDVFLSQPGYFPYAFCESSHRKYNQHMVFSYAHDLFVAFCSVLMRLYLNIAMKSFEA